MADDAEKVSRGTAGAVQTADSALDLELEAELHRFGLSGDLAAAVMKKEAIELVSFASPIILLPIDFFDPVVTSGFDAETLGLGLRHTIQLLRPHGPSQLLGETLLSLARASRMNESLETRLEWILEALAAFRRLNADRRLGRAYVDLATNLKDGHDYYDALYALDEAERYCIGNEDDGGIAAARYHRAHIYRMLGHPLEALHALASALRTLPAGSRAERWRNQIRSERVFNNLILERFDAALDDLNAWIGSGDTNYFPLLYRGEVFERRGNFKDALHDYCRAAIRFADDIVRMRSDRFRRISASEGRFRFERALGVALDLEERDSALSLLELINTGGRAILPPGRPTSPGDLEAVGRIRQGSAALLSDALAAVASGNAETLAACQNRADLLLSEHDLLAAPASPDGPDQQDLGGSLNAIQTRMIQLLPADSLLLEYTAVSDAVWVVAATRETTLLHRTKLDRFSLHMLKTSCIYECEGLLECVSLKILQQELLAPMERLLSQKAGVVIALAEEAYGVPFHAMNWSGGLLIDTHDVQYVIGGITVGPAAQNPVVNREATRTLRFLGTSNVPYAQLDELNGVEIEYRVVTGVMPASDVRATMPATSADLLGDERSAVLHVACHGKFEERAPLLSTLLFADRPVFAFEIALGSVASEFAFIAGCQTATATSAGGGYVQSLASAFQKGGVRSVAASLWPIDDEASAVLVRKLYELLCNGPNYSPLKAFCAAQRYLRAQQKFEHPSYWAPFLIFEDIAG
jgi:CHAT domain-containing protein/tetratricopeptide (TPR) repeat protein